MKNDAAEIIDVNVSLDRWPTRRLPLDEPAKLADKLRALGIVQAWAGSFDGLLHKDLSAVNARLAETCREQGDGLLIPFGSINPRLSGWREDLRRCRDDHGMKGIRLHPNYHGYRLDEPFFAELLDAAADARLIVQIAVRMEDDRTQHPLLSVPDVDVEPLIELARARKALRLVLLNSQRSVRIDTASLLVDAGQVYFDISHVEQVGGVARLLPNVPAERLLFGSHAPFFYPESARLKMHESELGGVQRTQIERENAARILNPSNGQP